MSIAERPISHQCLSQADKQTLAAISHNQVNLNLARSGKIISVLLRNGVMKISSLLSEEEEKN
jgi:hypothetical protein